MHRCAAGEHRAPAAPRLGSRARAVLAGCKPQLLPFACLAHRTERARCFPAGPFGVQPAVHGDRRLALLSLAATCYWSAPPTLVENDDTVIVPSGVFAGTIRTFTVSPLTMATLDALVQVVAP